MTIKKLTPRQVKWTEFLLEFNFVISYLSGKKNNKANALTHKPGNRPADKENKQLEYCMQVLLSPELFQQAVEVQPIEENENEDLLSTKTPKFIGQSDPVRQTKSNEKNSILLKQVMQANQKENSYASIHAYLKDYAMHAKPKTLKLRGCRVNKSLLMKKNQFWMPGNKGLWLEVLKEVHDQPAANHLGVEHTFTMVRRYHYWPHIHNTIKQYTQNCYVCKRAKAAHNTYNRLLQPLPVTKKPWIDMTINFMTGLLKYHTYDQIYDVIFMVIDCLSKEHH